MNSILTLLGILVAGVILFLAGNYLFGHNNSGGKRLIIFVVGILAVGLGAIMTLIPLKAGEWNEWFTYCIFGMGIIFTGSGFVLLLSSICAGKEKIDRVFDKITDGIQT
jgi:hypothetical protein